jgi:small-conductance mechanosensitive channel
VEYLHQTVYGNPVRAWLAAGGLAVLLLLAFWGIKVLAAWRRRRGSAREGQPLLVHTVVRAILDGTRWFSFAGIWIWALTLILDLPVKWEALLKNLALVALFVQAALWGQALIRAGARRATSARAQDPSVITTIRALVFILSVLVWTLAILMSLHNFGVSITAFITGLGIGGVAVALAVQNILSDVFSSASIVLDKPFEVGDFIIVGDAMGTVETIGVKTTRIRSYSGEELVFSNTDLLKNRIRNFKRIRERRVEFTIAISYHTPHPKAELVPGMIREIVGAREDVRFERAHLKEFGDASLNYEIVYFVVKPDYETFLNVHETVMLEILRRFQEEEIEIAHPSRTLYVAQGVAPVKW